MADRGTAYIDDQQALLAALPADLFEGELTEQDKLVYAGSVIMGKMLESETLRTQARNNTKEQFVNSPDLKPSATNAVIEAMDAHQAMSAQVLSTPEKLRGTDDVA